ncbi:MAG: hypothetical protein WB699_11140 [Bacteroidota bacterium]
MTTTDVMRLPSAGREEGGHRFDYKGLHRYILTLPTFREKTHFTDQALIFSLLGTLREMAAREKFDVYAYCFLPDRLLLIIRGKDEISDMKSFLRNFRVTTNDSMTPLLGHPLWSKKYIERVLRKSEDTKTVARDLFMTPVRKGLVKSLSDYPFLGSIAVPMAKILGESSAPPQRRSTPRGRPGATRKEFQRGRTQGGGGPRRPHRS